MTRRTIASDLSTSAKYVEIDNIAAVSAGGMSSFTGKDGITYMLLSLQRQGEPVQFVILDLGGLTTVAGYNVYRNGESATLSCSHAATLKRQRLRRASMAMLYRPSTSMARHLTCLLCQQLTSSAPAQPRLLLNTNAKQSSYGYNVLLTFADPDMYQNAASKENFEAKQQSAKRFMALTARSYQSGWTVNNDEAFDGSKSVTVDAQNSAFGVIPCRGYALYAPRSPQR